MSGALFERLELIDDPAPRNAALNMAIDEALIESLGDAPILRFYRWARPSVSFGCFEALALVERDYPAHEWVRRWTGGGVVEHGEDVTYSLIAPRQSTLGRMKPMEAYRVLHIALADALGLPGDVYASNHQKMSAACFENPVRHDLMSGPRKIAGAAQRRTRTALLHQGSVLTSQRFARPFAESLAQAIVERNLSPRELDLAAQIEQKRYSARDWLERF